MVIMTRYFKKARRSLGRKGASFALPHFPISQRVYTATNAVKMSPKSVVILLKTSTSWSIFHQQPILLERARLFAGHFLCISRMRLTLVYASNKLYRRQVGSKIVVAHFTLLRTLRLSSFALVAIFVRTTKQGCRLQALCDQVDRIRYLPETPSEVFAIGKGCDRGVASRVQNPTYK